MMVSQLLYLAAAATNPSVNVGTMPWTTLPSIPIGAGRLDGVDGRSGLLNILKKKQCDLPGVTRDNLEIWYAMYITPEGRVTKIIVEPKKCRPLESLVGAMALQLVKTNKIKPPLGERPGWYASRIRFVS